MVTLKKTIKVITEVDECSRKPKKTEKKEIKYDLDTEKIFSDKNIQDIFNGIIRKKIKSKGYINRNAFLSAVKIFKARCKTHPRYKNIANELEVWLSAKMEYLQNKSTQRPVKGGKLLQKDYGVNMFGKPIESYTEEKRLLFNIFADTRAELYIIGTKTGEKAPQAAMPRAHAPQTVAPDEKAPPLKETSTPAPQSGAQLPAASPPAARPPAASPPSDFTALLPDYEKTHKDLKELNDEINLAIGKPDDIRKWWEVNFGVWLAKKDKQLREIVDEKSGARNTLKKITETEAHKNNDKDAVNAAEIISQHINKAEENLEKVRALSAAFHTIIDLSIKKDAQYDILRAFLKKEENSEIKLLIYEKSMETLEKYINSLQPGASFNQEKIDKIKTYIQTQSLENPLEAVILLAGAVNYLDVKDNKDYSELIKKIDAAANAPSPAMPPRAELPEEAPPVEKAKNDPDVEREYGILEMIIKKDSDYMEQPGYRIQDLKDRETGKVTGTRKTTRGIEIKYHKKTAEFEEYDITYTYYYEYFNLENKLLKSAKDIQKAVYKKYPDGKITVEYPQE